ncbi:MAG: hypothetical protein JXR61_07950 [Prolixibacteraceae bacterium]|nr:hypothetical protein [Prolixibacteraceae bacterium]
MNFFLKPILILFFAVLCFPIVAQENPDQPEIKVNLDNEGNAYAGIKMVSQIWSRYIWNNPDVNGTEQYSDMDMGIRRTRIFMFAGLHDRVFVYSQLGIDNLTYRSSQNTSMNLIDAQAEFVVSKNKLSIGMGLNSWNGISRYNSSNFTEFLLVDQPGFTSPFDGTFDKSGSQFGIFARGVLGKLQYRLAISKPFETGIDSVSVPKTTERINENFALKGYVSWQFFDAENSSFPFMTMNNLGRKKMLNVGAGFYYHPQAMLVEAEKDLSTVDPFLSAWLISNGQEHLLANYADYYPSDISDIFIASADIFLDMPLRNRGAITSYMAYYYNFFGPNYLKSMAAMNVSRLNSDLSLSQGAGNSQWETGTGHILHGEVGYLIPGKNTKNLFQPFGAFTMKSFEGLDETSFQFDAGINWLMYNHYIKWTLQYSTRPIFTEVEDQNRWSSSKGQLTLQAQVSF